MKKLLFFISLLFVIAFQLNAQEFIKQLYSYDRGNPDDNDGVYLVGTKVNIIVISADHRTNLQGTISIESKKLEYNTGIRSLENLGAGIYQYVWDTSQLSKGNDYIVFVRLRDESGKVSDGNFLIELYTSDLLLGTINSYDSSNPEDADNIYHAGQKVKISVAYNTKEPPNGMLEIRSETTGYILRKIELQKGTENTLEYVWDTKGLNEARDYVVTITLADQAGHQVTSRSLVITIDNTPPEILKVTAYNSQDILDNDNIYRSGQTIAIDVQMKEKQGNLDAKIQIKSQSVLYDTGIQRLIYQGEGLWRYLWNTTRLNPAKDYVAYIIIADQAALEDQNSSLRFEIDNTPPQNGKISINNDDIYTISRTVNLSLYADGASRMYISGNVDDTIATFEWIPYSTELQVELTKGDGNKSISVRFIDEAQNESQSFSDSIILDAEPPEIKMVSSQDKSDRLDNDNIYSAGQIITITAEISENLVKLEGVLSITSVSNSYNSGLQKMTDAGQGVYVFDWNTSGLLEGNYVVSIELTDPLGRKATNRELRIIIDNTPPDNGKLIINNGKNVTESRTIKLTLFASGDPREVFIEGNLIADTNTFQWIPYNTQVIVNLSDSDGEKKVQVRFRDAARNVGSIVTETITLDRKAPTSPSISIENNAPYTTKRTVTLRIKADNAVRMLINGDVLNEDFTFDFIDYREQVTVTLTPGDGEKRVGVVFRNSLGIQSDRIEDTIFLDTTEPVFMSIESYDFQNTLDNDGIYRPGQNIVISVVAGVVEVSLKARIKITSKKAPYDTGFQEMFPGINRTTFTYLWNTKSLQDSDDYNVLIELTDAAGHKTENSSLVITIDSSPPTNGQMTINEDSETTDSRTVRLRLSAVDATEMFISGDLFDDGNTFRWINYKTDLMVNLSGDDGLKTVQVKFRDAAGNENSGVIKTIKLDRKSPISLKLSISPDPDGIPSEYTPYREVYLRLSAYNAIEMYISGDVVDDEKTFQWISYTTQLKVNLIQNDGLKTILARFRNLPGILSEQVSSQIILDTTRPEIISVTSQNAQDPNDRDGWYRPGLIRIIAQVKEANEPELKITIESQKNGYNPGKQTMRLQTPAIGDRWTFEYIWDTRGLDDSSDYSINVEAKDKVGWVSTFTPDVLILDSIPPKNPKITVNKGNLRTASRSVSLEAWADDGVEMFVTGDIRDDDNTFQWISITTINVMLNAGEGLKNIQVKFRDGAGNETETLKAELILSLLPPVIQIVDSWDTSDPSDNDEKYHAGELISINIKAQSREDAPRIETGLFGTVTIQSSDGKYKSGRKSTREEIGGWYSYNWDTKGLAEGVYEVIATLADGLGREVTDQSFRIVIDNTPPDSPMININDRAKYTNSRAVNLSLQANEATWVFISGDVIQEKAITSEWIPYKDGFRITVKLTATEGVKKIQAKFKDDADNFTDFVSSQIILDTTGPRIISAEINN
ncbi:hypothetical protein FJZ33_01260, partial [Candidatus Poribacteria bacterium]|nr:hypothetical protein [Candidatus Poribacteria bacterium]